MRRIGSVTVGVLALATALAAHAAPAVVSPETVVPSTMCGEYFLIPLEVDLDGDGTPTTLMAIFDTGGLGLHIDPEAVVRAGGDRVAERQQITIRDASAGPLKFKKLRPTTVQLDHLSRVLGMQIDVFLPFRAFERHLLTLDYPAREIRVGVGRLPPPDGVGLFRARGRDERPYLETSIAGRTHRLLIDSGSSGSIALHDGRDLPWISEPLPIAVSQGMERLNFQDVGRLDADLEIAGVTVARPLVTTGARTELLGTAVMRRFAWTFDQRTRRVRIRADSREPLRIPAKRGTGAVMFPTTDGYEVSRVLDDTPAARAGLRAGDLVVAVDGRPAGRHDCDRWNADERASTTLTVLRDGATSEIRIDLVDLVP